MMDLKNHTERLYSSLNDQNLKDFKKVVISSFYKLAVVYTKRPRFQML